MPSQVELVPFKTDSRKKGKGLAEWIKWQSACPACARPWVQIPVPPKKKKKRLQDAAWPIPPCEDTAIFYLWGSGPSPATKSASASIMDFPASRPWAIHFQCLQVTEPKVFCYSFSHELRRDPSKWYQSWKFSLGRSRGSNLCAHGVSHWRCDMSLHISHASV
jgi:hypothetical protein